MAKNSKDISSTTEEEEKQPSPSKAKPADLGRIDWGFGSVSNVQSKDIVTIVNTITTFLMTLVIFAFSGAFIYAGDGLREAGMAFFGAGVSYWLKSKK